MKINILSKSNLINIRREAFKKTLHKKCKNKAEFLILGLACEMIIKSTKKINDFDVLLGRNITEGKYDYRFDRVI